MSSGIIVVYVSGPMTLGDVWLNTRYGIQVGDILARLGYAPIVPHLSSFWHTIFPHDHKFWLGLDLKIIERCVDVNLRIPGTSRGADIEEAHCHTLKIPVAKTLNALLMRFPPGGKTPQQVLLEYDETKLRTGFVEWSIDEID